jgi:ABC-type nitrate/sulfonate/bicarbonate transport system permease component
MSWRSLRGLLPIAVLLGIWQLLGHPNSATAPPPSTWWPAFTSIEKSGAFWPAFEKTMLLFVEGLVVATILGVVLGIALGSSRRIAQALGPLFEFLRATPAAAIVPGAVLLFHANSRTDIGIVVYGSIWPVLLNTAAARAALPPLRLDVAHALGLSRWDRMRKIVLPSLLPEIVVGVRVAAPICLIITLLVDILVGSGGIGYLLIQYQQTFIAANAFAMLAVIGIIGIAINLALGSADRVVLRRWPAAGGRGR